jgi:AmmeMemoRadiSam system protein A
MSYKELAKQSLEYAVANNKVMQLPDNLPDELLANEAGVFVSIHMDGQLRGCIGTIAPTTENVALEIIQNTVSAGMSDPRFPPVSVSELPFLVYKVDVLFPPEPISDIGELDVKRYGVIATNGRKRGLLLPNLDGVDSIEEQVAIAMQKAGIHEGENVELERFEVVRYE